MSIELYRHISAMEPMFPQDEKGILSELIKTLLQKSSALSNSLHPITREAVVKLVRPMNSYYSNLIEGHNTHPLDIEKAMKKDYSSDPIKRVLQIESKVHIEVQERMEIRLREEKDLDICSLDFITWIHREFYKELPEDFRFVKTKSDDTVEVIAGEIRTTEVEVGAHIAPASDSLLEFLKRFDEVYNPNTITDFTRRITAAAASHHRLAWIHPFLDGNGRVMRLFTHAYLIREGLDGGGMWSISRGFARRKEDYRATLHNADQQRYNNYDGRGNLSNKGLLEFCEFFLNAAIDQVDFMSQMFDLDEMQERINRFVDLQITRGRFKEESKYILQEVFFKGQVYRKEIVRITGKSDNTARAIMNELIEHELLVSDTATGPLRINFPIAYVAYFFPHLYPDNIEATLG